MTETSKPALAFPCEFPLKVIGKDEDGFEEMVIVIIQKHVPRLIRSSFTNRSSREGKYVSVSVTFTADSREQMDNLYRELTAHPKVLWVI
ncbi:MAG TPA: DUF493 domain-containing protein [Longilinea sp.]|nr:DUF493 domain-containing protein [Longilinea sp.]